MAPLAKSNDNCEQLQSLGLGSTTADETFNARGQRIKKLTARRKVLVLPRNSGGSALPPSAKSKENCEQDSDGGLESTMRVFPTHTGSADSTIVAREGQCRVISTISAEDACLARRKRKTRLDSLRAPAETNT
ncbi:hypothetical protein PIB30_087232, partial [Stylosanthes scabra]|nr:hypothetical protein [Stylosanthes scabra]